MTKCRQRLNAWSPVEDEVIEKHYPVGGSTACIALLPKRSRHAITTRASDLGVYSGLAGRPWSSEEDEILLRAGAPKKALAMLDRTPASVRKRWRILQRIGRAPAPEPRKRLEAPAVRQKDALPQAYLRIKRGEAHEFAHVHRPIGTWELNPEQIKHMAKATPFEALEPA